MDRAFGYGPKGWGFESLWARQVKASQKCGAFCFVGLPLASGLQMGELSVGSGWSSGLRACLGMSEHAFLPGEDKLVFGIMVHGPAQIVRSQKPHIWAPGLTGRWQWGHLRPTGGTTTGVGRWTGAERTRGARWNMGWCSSMPWDMST